MIGRSSLIAAIVTIVFLMACAILRLGVGSDVGPGRIFLLLIGSVVLLYLIAKHPAAFMAPMLFAPRAKKLPFISSFPFVGGFTELGITAGIVALAVFVRIVLPRRRSWRLREAFRENHKTIYTYLLFAAVLSLSYTYTSAPDYGGAKLWRFVVLGSLAFFAPFVLLTSEEDFHDFTYGTLLFALGVAVTSLRFSHHGRIGSAQNIVHIGIGQLMGMALLLLFYHRFKSKRIRILALLICVPWLSIGLASAEARGPLLAVLLALAVGAFAPWWDARFISRKQVTVLLCAVVVAVVGLSAYWFRGVAQSRLQAKTTELTLILEGSPEASGSATERLVYYHAALEEIPDHPLFGLGIGGWSVYYWNQDMRHYPHNLFLEIAVEEGLVGLTALLMLLGSVFVTLKRTAYRVAQQFPSLLPVFVYLLTATMFSGDIDDNRFLWSWCGVVLAVTAMVLTRVTVESPASSEAVELEGLGAVPPAVDRL